MATDELGRTEAAEAEDDRRPASSETSPAPEHPGDRQPRAPDATQETGDQEPGGRDPEPAEAGTRDDHADNMRDQGAPIPPEDDSRQNDGQDRDELRSPAGEPREDTSGPDQGDPRDRETYADDMRRAEPVDAGLEGTPDRDDVQRDPASGTSAEDDLGPSAIDGAESRSREEYASDMREDGDPLAADTQQPGSTDTPSDEADSTSPGPEADAAGLGGEPGDQRSGEPGPELEAAHDGDVRDEGSSEAGRKVYVDGREIEITHDRADGLWVEGLPGEVPGTPEGDPYGTARVGDMMTSPESSRLSRSEKAARTMCERLDDITEELDHSAETLQDLLDKAPRPTHSGTVQDRMPVISSGGADHGINVGHVLDAALVLTAVGVKLHQIHERRQERRMEGTSYAGN